MSKQLQQNIGRMRDFKNPNKRYHLKQPNPKDYTAALSHKRRNTSLDSSTTEEPDKKKGALHRRKAQAELESEPERQCLLYMRDLSQEVGHHEIFEHFCIFGNLKRVSVRQRTEHSKYATILYTSTESIELALGANPHKLKDKHYYCHKAGTWHLRWLKIDRCISELHNRSNSQDRSQIRIFNGQSLHSYVYPPTVKQQSHHNKTKQPDQAGGNKSTRLLPQSSLILLQFLRAEQPPSLTVNKPVPNACGFNFYPKMLMSSMGKHFNFVRHSYTDFKSYQECPGKYKQVPIDAKIGLNTNSYAAQRCEQDFNFPFYNNC